MAHRPIREAWLSHRFEGNRNKIARSRSLGFRKVGRLEKLVKIPKQDTSIYRWLKHSILDYLYCSGVHGLRYLGEKSRPWIERLYWMFVLLVSLAISSTLILGVWRRWVDSPVLVTFMDKPVRIWDIPFPTVTVCPADKYDNEVFDYQLALSSNRSLLSSEAKKLLDDITILCRSEAEMPYYDNENLPRFTNSSTIDNMILVTPQMFEPGNHYCRANTLRQDICNNTAEIVLTREGVCRAYNLLPAKLLFKPSTVQYSQAKDVSIPEVWSLEKGYTEDSLLSDAPFRLSGSGFERGVAFTLRSEFLNQDYSCRLLQGFRVSLTMPSEIPVMDDFFLLPSNGMSRVAIHPHIMYTSEALRGYAPEHRYCFFPSERELAYFFTYTKANCNLECLTNYTLKACKCVEFYMPRNATTYICGIGSANCVIRAKEHLNQKIMDEQTSNVKNADSCNCLPSCVSIHFTAEITQGELDMEELVMESLVPDEYLFNSASILAIYFKRDEYTGIIRRELYSLFDLIANCGGLLGLCCGISALSFAELFYHFTIRLLNNVYRKTKKPLYFYQ